MRSTYPTRWSPGRNILCFEVESARWGSGGRVETRFTFLMRKVTIPASLEEASEEDPPTVTCK